MEKDLKESKIIKEYIKKLEEANQEIFKLARKRLSEKPNLTLKEFEGYEKFYNKLLKCNGIKPREE